MTSPVVSVIIPVYNAARYLRAALSSALAQDYRHTDILVVDDGSTDDTPAVLASFGDRVRYIRQDNQGPAAARNLGVQTTDGELIAFLDADDLWEPHKLVRQVSVMLQQPELLYTVAMFRYFVDDGRALPADFNPALLNQDLIGRIPSTLVARREAFAVIGPFTRGLSTVDDLEWFTRAKDLRVPMAVVPEVLLRKRIHESNVSAAAQTNTPILLRVLHDSIRRQRQQAIDTTGENG